MCKFHYFSICSFSDRSFLPTLNRVGEILLSCGTPNDKYADQWTHNFRVLHHVFDSKDMTVKELAFMNHNEEMTVY